ncbi:biotin--[acetyl-CoA-carboxylase] ligase [Flavobacteriales bacterium]|nr:biotin--[acetyl-CoA-carboxylase] ligase [Flavobacteriales bacterium]
MCSSFFSKNQIKLDETDSTNDFLLDLDKMTFINSNVVVTANYQKFGRGKQIRKWESKKGKNLLLSILFKHSLKLKEQFNFSVIISLALKDLLTEILEEEVFIKWPNDIIVNDKKIAGFIIENKSNNSVIHTSILGVGLNLNQSLFHNYTPEATSVIKLIKKESEVDLIKERLLLYLEKYYLSENSLIENLNKYNDCLYAKNKDLKFKSKNKNFKGKILRVKKSGEIVIKTIKEEKTVELNDLEYIF